MYILSIHRTNHSKMTVLHELSQLMQTGLSREQLRICIDLIQTGEDPKAIAVRYS